MVDEAYSRALAVVRGEKPPEAVLHTFQQIMAQIPPKVGDVIRIDIPGVKGEIPILSAGHGVEFMIKFAGFKVIPILLPGFNLQNPQHQEIMAQFVQMAIYWYARGWLSPFPGYTLPQYPSPPDETSLETDRHRFYARGYPPAVDRCQAYEAVMDLNSAGMWPGTESSGGRMVSIWAHGAGNMQYSNAVEAVFKLMHTAKGKMAKSEFGIERVDSDSEAQQIYETCFMYVMYWVVKGWLIVPYPQSSHPEVLRRRANRFSGTKGIRNSDTRHPLPVEIFSRLLIMHEMTFEMKHPEIYYADWATLEENLMNEAHDHPEHFPGDIARIYGDYAAFEKFLMDRRRTTG